jgi:hypothetical protein
MSFLAIALTAFFIWVVLILFGHVSQFGVHVLLAVAVIFALWWLFGWASSH